MVLPTLMESFSASYPEAMYFGLPIVTSDLDFARETCGSAAIFVNPWDPADIALGKKKVMDDQGLRSELVDLGHQQYMRYSMPWETIASRYLAVLEG